MIESNVKPDKATLVARLGALIMRWQEATQRYDETVGKLWSLNPSERLCLSFLADGPRPASAIALATQLTPAAVTALVDRLERRGFVRRRPDPGDRRRVMVDLDSAAFELMERAYLPLKSAGETMLSAHSAEQLATFAAILEESIAVQDDMRARLEGSQETL